MNSTDSVPRAAAPDAGADPRALAGLAAGAHVHLLDVGEREPEALAADVGAQHEGVARDLVQPEGRRQSGRERRDAHPLARRHLRQRGPHAGGARSARRSGGAAAPVRGEARGEQRRREQDARRDGTSSRAHHEAGGGVSVRRRVPRAPPLHALQHVADRDARHAPRAVRHARRVVLARVAVRVDEQVVEAPVRADAPRVGVAHQRDHRPAERHAHVQRPVSGERTSAAPSRMPTAGAARSRAR
jgi:hypothetical protein